jgi:hypothetical protein
VEALRAEGIEVDGVEKILRVDVSAAIKQAIRQSEAQSDLQTLALLAQSAGLEAVQSLVDIHILRQAFTDADSSPFGPAGAHEHLRRIDTAVRSLENWTVDPALAAPLANRLRSDAPVIEAADQQVADLVARLKGGDAVPRPRWTRTVRTT